MWEGGRKGRMERDDGRNELVLFGDFGYNEMEKVWRVFGRR
jgi:hypothetical protein